MFYNVPFKFLSHDIISATEVIKYFLLIILIGISTIYPRFAASQSAIQFQPLPYEDPIKGRNSYAYNAAIGKPENDDERRAFLNEIKPYAIQAEKNFKIPACAIGTMAALESGFGFTRNAHFAKNIFGIKKPIGKDTDDSWQLKGQPDESWPSCKTKIIDARNGKDRLIFDERKRCDNRYVKFNNYQDSINYLAGTTLQKKRYQLALNNYLNNRKSGMNAAKACKTYIFDIVSGGFSHIGSRAYLRKATPILNKWNLYEWSQ